MCRKDYNVDNNQSSIQDIEFGKGGGGEKLHKTLSRGYNLHGIGGLLRLQSER